MTGGGAAGNGIGGVAAAKGLTIRNGTVVGFKGYGIIVSGDRLTVENMQIANNKRGIFCGARARIRNNTISLNGQDGIICTTGLIEGNLVDRNGGNGITLGDGNILNNQIYDNLVDGLQISSGNVVGNMIERNTGFGIEGSLNDKIGYGNNSIFNNDGPAPLSGCCFFKMQPNACDGSCP